jgi:outer membrane immunogenic protein
MQTFKLIKLVLATTALSSVLLASAATVAGAADAPPPRPVYKLPPPPYFTWTGFYVGAHIGGGWFDVDGFGSNSGFLGGGQVGYNYQIGNWVWGGELEVSGTSIGNNGVNVNTATTLAARGGYAFGRWLVYGKFGAGWLDVSGPGFGGTTSSALFGVGTEYALTPNWSAKIEYNYYDLAHDAYGDSASFQTIKAGVNYKFGPGWPF